MPVRYCYDYHLYLAIMSPMLFIMEEDIDMYRVQIEEIKKKL